MRVRTAAGGKSPGRRAFSAARRGPPAALAPTAARVPRMADELQVEADEHHDRAGGLLCYGWGRQAQPGSDNLQIPPPPPPLPRRSAHSSERQAAA